jgi:MFS family permease
VLNLALADVRYGLGPYAIVYLMAEQGWDEASLALAFSFGNLTGLLSQAPIGAMVDAVRPKRALLICALLMVTASAFAIVLAPRFWPVSAASVLGALANSTLGTTLAAVSLGVVGHARLARRAARNEALFHAGSAAVNVAILLAAPFYGIAAAFWLLALAAAISVAAVLAIPARAIDYDVARGFTRRSVTDIPEQQDRQVSPWRALLASRPLIVFALCGALFHMANASMLGLVVQRTSRIDPAGAAQLAAACIIAAQVAMVATAALVGARADAWGRRPIFLTAFTALTLRGVLYTLSDHPAWTLVVQLLDGVGVGVFGALFPVVVADLARGSGRFNAAQGGVGTVHSLGGFLSWPLAGTIVVWAGYDAAFLILAATAATGLALFWAAMPETRGAAPVTADKDPGRT